jgi:hypothetical protein
MAAEQRDGFLLVRLEGEAYDLGLQHGVALRPQIWALWDACQRLILNARGPLFGWGLRRVLVGAARVMERHVSADIRRELRGVADGCGLGYGNILLLNCFDDLMNNLRFFDALAARFACSAFAAVGERAADGGVIAGRNLDYWFRSEFAAAGYEPTAALQRHVVAFVYQPARGHAFVSVGWPGIIGAVTAQNAAGLVLACLTSPAWSERPWGTPLPFLYREIAQHAATLAEAGARLRAARRTIGNNLLVASAAEGDARVFELTSRQLVARAPRAGALASTNHFLSPELLADQTGLVAINSPRRLARLEELLAEGTVDVSRANAILGDQRCLDDAECVWARLRNAGTIYSTTFEPGAGRIWVRAGDNDRRGFEPVAVPGAAAPAREAARRRLASARA